ncbi:hypothetical protein GCM10023166_03310 [Paeniglutamicibacter cryotolerans]
MTSSPFAFFRGAALIKTADLASTPDSGLQAQICDDARLSDSDLFGAPEHPSIFDLYDFEDTLAGQCAWDLWRLAASFEIVGREGDFFRTKRREITCAVGRAYRLTRIRE